MRGRQKIDLTGQRFGRLIVRCEDGRSAAGQVRWLCDCDCGNQVTVNSQGLRRTEGPTRSCGCFKRETIFPKGRKIGNEANTRHGHATRRNGVTRAYSIWRGMIRRCEYYRAFKNYGGRGITVCDRWRQDFAAFLSDMGEPPVGYTLDRINNDGNYEPGNCRWATRKEQCSNQRPRQRKAA